MSQRLFIPDFFSAEEIHQSQARLDALGWRPAPVRFASGARFSERLRDSERVEFVDQPLADSLWLRLRERVAAPALELLAPGRGAPVSMRAWFRGYRYLPGQRFGKHRDAFERDGELVSRVTALIYLSGSEQGDGATIFHPERGSGGRPERVIPQSGGLLLFHSQLLHEGEAPATGVKMVLRTDLMFHS